MFFIGEAIQKGWADAKNKPGFYIPLLVIYFGIIIFASMILNYLGIIGQILLVILEMWLSVGLILIALKRAKDEEVKIMDLFNGGQYILNYIIANILYTLIMLGGFILLIIPGVVWSIKYMMFPYLIIDKNLGAVESLKESGVITKGKKWDLLGLNVVTSIIGILGILALLIGFFWAYPTILIANAVVYLKLK